MVWGVMHDAVIELLTFRICYVNDFSVVGKDIDFLKSFHVGETDLFQYASKLFVVYITHHAITSARLVTPSNQCFSSECPSTSRQ